MTEDYQAALARLKADLDEVEGAMRRLDEGTYGRCEACGQEIPDSQLELSPTAHRCPDCS
ncbi:MAG TPA: TraR/DksA C4-type zinc finger protein [Acidimicrobiales bacterium]|nr:TraR/DksA C4-type zinc finger protein [Acidimicrobiales bacterium]